MRYFNERKINQRLVACRCAWEAHHRSREDDFCESRNTCSIADRLTNLTCAENYRPPYRTVENKARGLTRAIHYYTKDTPLNTLIVYASIKTTVLLGAILVSLRYQRSQLLRSPVFLPKWDGAWDQGIACQGYA